MKFKNTPLVHVFYGPEKLSVGRLAIKNRRIFFEYDLTFLKTNLQISPIKLPLKAGLMAGEETIFEGLFGVFNDSLPDGWGRLLLDRKLMTLGITQTRLSPLDRLCYAGKSLGAFSYEPEISHLPNLFSETLDEIADHILHVQEKEDTQFLDNLLALNGTSAGVRPKIILQLPNGDSWIVKFPALIDPKDMGPIEFAYHLLAKEAGLNVPEAALFPSKKGPGYFGVKRFDSHENRPLHVHTISGLLHADHRIPCLDYDTILKATLLLTRDIRECEKQFRAAAFNVLTHNRDDHGKNFSFLMDETGVWRVSPAYDLTFSFGPAGEHCTTIMGEGKNPTLSHMLKLSDAHGIKKNKALNILEEVKNAVLKWPTLAKNAGVTEKSAILIQKNLSQVMTGF